MCLQNSRSPTPPQARQRVPARQQRGLSALRNATGAGRSREWELGQRQDRLLRSADSHAEERREGKDHEPRAPREASEMAPPSPPSLSQWPRDAPPGGDARDTWQKRRKPGQREKKLLFYVITQATRAASSMTSVSFRISPTSSVTPPLQSGPPHARPLPSVKMADWRGREVGSRRDSGGR